ncbi:hypothetical protein HN51_035309 [Arachis hypogaea]
MVDVAEGQYWKPSTIEVAVSCLIPRWLRITVNRSVGGRTGSCCCSSWGLIVVIVLLKHSLLTDPVDAEKEEPEHWKRGWLLRALLESHKREML